MSAQFRFAKVAAPILSLVIVVSGLGLASPANAATYDGTNGTIDCSTAGTATIVNNVVTSQNNCIGAVEIPSGVTSIGNEVFQFNDAIISITIPATTTSIGDYAFSYATNLQTVKIANASQLTSIGESAFDSASALAVITIQSNVSSIGSYAFYGASSLTTVTFLGNAPLIGTDAFSSVAIGAKARVRPEATGFASAGQTWNGLSIEYNNEFYCATGLPAGQESSPTYTIIDGVVSAGNDCTGAVVIPNGASSIGANAFGGGTLTSINIPASVTTIERVAFLSTRNLQTVTFAQGSQLNSIGNAAFAEATALTSITIPASVTSIGDDTFLGTTSLQTVTFAQGSQLTYLGDYAFENASALTGINIPAGVTRIGYRTFAGTNSLTSITIPSGVTSIESYAFENASSLASVYFLGDAPSVGDEVFTGIASGAKAYIKYGSAGFANEGQLWNGLSVEDDANTVIFNSTGGANVDPGAFVAGSTIQTAPTSTRAGYTLTGWSTSSNGSVVTFPYEPGVNTDITLFAIWSANTNTVMYNSTGGSSVDSGSFITDGTIQTAPTSTRAGYTLEGWSPSENGTVIEFPYSPTAAASLTLYAIWSANLNTVTFNSASGSSVADGSFRTGGNIQAAPVSTRAGYTLTGWSTSESGSVVEFPYTPAATTNITLFAIWSLNTYTVTYNSAFGTPVTQGAFVSGGSIQTAPTTTRPGYIFKGWSTTENGSVIEFPYSPTVDSNITLYAVWQLGNGEFKCTTGSPLVGLENSPTYTITNGVVSAGTDCVGAVAIPNGVTSIGNYAFYGDYALSSISLPSTVTSIGSGAFANTYALTSFVIPAGVTSIGEDAFANATVLTSITIPAGVTSIGKNALRNTRSLVAINVASGNVNFSSIGGVLFNKAETLLIQYPIGALATSYMVPNGVTSIGDFAFYRSSSLSLITISASVTSIGMSSFESATSLRSVLFAENSQLTTISKYAFYSASALTSINIPDQVTSIGYGAFAHAASLSSIYLGARVSSIGDEAFGNATSLTSIRIPASVTSIGNYAFYNTTALTSITVDANNSSYTAVDGVLYNKSLTSLRQYPAGLNADSFNIPSGITSIGIYAFYKTKLKYITIPASVTTIETDAFSGASLLSSVTFADGSQITSIPGWAFYGATSLTSITIPARVTFIGSYAFTNSTSLRDIYFLGNAPSVVSGAFSGVASGAKAHIKSRAKNFASAGQTWNGLTVEVIEDPRFTVTYNSANGSQVAASSITADDTIETAPVSTRAGYTLAGWSRSADGSVVAFPYSPLATTDFTLYAIWSANTNTVSYNSASGSSVSDGSFTTDGSIAVAPVSTRAGYTLAGWSTTSNGSVVEFPYAPTATTNLTLYAIWSANTNTVSYDSASGSSVSDGSFRTGGSIAVAPVSTRAGYTLTGWSTTVNGLVVEFPYAPAATTNLTLYAIWSANTNTVSYNSASGSSVSDGSFRTGGSIAVAPVSTRAGYTLAGWSTTVNGLVVEFPYAPAATTNITLYAIWHLNNGAFKCTTGLPIVGDDQSPTYTITDGEVTLGNNCAGVVVFPSGVTTIGSFAFHNTSAMTSVTLPASVTTIRDYAFNNASALTSFNVDLDNPNFASSNGVLFDKALTTLIQYPAGKTNVSYYIPASVSSICRYAFYYTSALATITIPDSVVVIGESAFSNATGLTSVSIPASVTTIGQYAFFNTTALTAITVDSNNSNYRSTNGVLFNKSVTNLIQYPGGKTNRYYTVPASVTSIGNFALSDASALTSITIPSGITQIGDNTVSSSVEVLRFLGAAPTDVSISAFAFVTTKATAYLTASATGFNLDGSNKWQGLNVAYPQSTNSPTGYANCMQGSQLTGVLFITNKVVSNQVACDGDASIPTGVTGIGNGAFEDASALASVTIPATVNNIDANVFAGASSLVDLYFLGNAPTQVSPDAFTNIGNNATVFRRPGTRFKIVEDLWNGLPIDIGSLTKFSGNTNNSGAAPSQIMRRAGQNFVVPDNSDGLVKNGFTFAGWNTLANGRGMQVNPGETLEMPQGGMSLHAMWVKRPVKASVITKPAISGFAISTLKGSNTLNASTGRWTGYPNPTFSFQWYSCAEEIKTRISVLPASCSIINGATSSKLAVTKRFKDSYLVVEVTGASVGTTSTRSLSFSTVKVK